jgi:hypothetical protein
MTGRPYAARAAKFLRDVLAGGPLRVPELDRLARAAGLLDERQRITHAKLFKAAKKSLGIRSVRNGFGSGGEWLWLLDKQAAQPITEASGHPVAGSAPVTWVEGIARLDYYRAPTDIPAHRWRQFVSDCNNFVASGENWAERAAELGWDARALFGCHRNRPLLHLGSAGLLWAINGGRLIELHRDWATIELAVDGSRRVFHRRRLDGANITLPWIGLRQRVGG